MITRKQIEKKLISILNKTEEVWVKHHTNSTEALRWWLAYTDAEEMVETYNVREWGELILDGLPPVPSTIGEIADILQERTEGDSEELEGYFQSLETFYSENEREDED